MITVFQCITMEGWTDVLYYVSRHFLESSQMTESDTQPLVAPPSLMLLCLLSTLCMTRPAVAAHYRRKHVYLDRRKLKDPLFLNCEFGCLLIIKRVLKLNSSSTNRPFLRQIRLGRDSCALGTNYCHIAKDRSPIMSACIF